MTTLLLEIDEETLARAKRQAEEHGCDIREELVVHVKAAEPSTQAECVAKQTGAFKRLMELSKLYPIVIEGGMPSREERNAR